MNTIDYLSYLSDNIKSNKLYSELSQDAGEIPFDKPVVLSDGTVLVRKQVPKAENSKSFQKSRHPHFARTLRFTRVTRRGQVRLWESKSHK